jgi:hypothetical protein
MGADTASGTGTWSPTLDHGSMYISTGSSMHDNDWPIAGQITKDGTNYSYKAKFIRSGITITWDAKIYKQAEECPYDQNGNITGDIPDDVLCDKIRHMIKENIDDRVAISS